MTLVYWMLSSALFGALAGLASAAAERILRITGRPGRAPWLLALAAGSLWPLLAPALHRVAGGNAGASLLPIVRLPAIQVFPDGFAYVSNVLTPIAVYAQRVLAATWIIASLVLLLRLVLSHRSLMRARLGADERVVDDVPVIVTQSLGPAVMGVRDPRILVPRWLLDFDAPLRALILRHESEHCRARDTRFVMGAALATALFPWNPAVWWHARRLRLAIELDCDARVLERGRGNVERYATLLVMIAQRQSTPRLAPTLVASTSHLERRIIAMRTALPRRPIPQIVLGGAFAVAATITACSTPIANGTAGPDVAPGRAVIEKPDPNRAYFEFEVNQPVQPLPGNRSPRYPDALRTTNTEGEVLIEFIVNREGRVEPGSFKTLKATHPELDAAVRASLIEMRFSPARMKDTPVRQVVQQPFVFKLSKNSTPPDTAPRRNVKIF